MLCELLMECPAIFSYFFMFFSYFSCSNFLFSYFLEPMCCLTPCQRPILLIQKRKKASVQLGTPNRQMQDLFSRPTGKKI